MPEGFGKGKPLRAHQQDESLIPETARRKSRRIAERCSCARVRFAAPVLARLFALSAPFCCDGFATGGSGGMS